MARRPEIRDDLHGFLIVWGGIALHAGVWITFGFGPMLMLGGAVTLAIAVVFA